MKNLLLALVAAPVALWRPLPLFAGEFDSAGVKIRNFSPGRGAAPAACLRGIAQLAVTEGEVKAIHVPVDLIVGDHDPYRQTYVEPLRALRPDWPEHLVAGAGHRDCVARPEFKAELKTALDRASKR